MDYLCTSLHDPLHIQLVPHNMKVLQYILLATIAPTMLVKVTASSSGEEALCPCPCK